MKVAVHISIGNPEITLVGEAPVFAKQIDYRKGYDKTLSNIGFWLENWRYKGNSGPANKSRVFVPWTSALYIVALEE